MTNPISLIQNELEHAFKNNQFILYYQPKMDLMTQSFSGVEALIRWEHPTLGIIDPLIFIPLAEEMGLILQIEKWILHEACRTNKQWQKKGYQPIVIAVNLSPQQFHHPHIVSLIENTLQETGLDPHYLEIEITEMTVMDDIKRINKFLQHLKSLGITISIDDFGTGHTSISYLRDFPIDVLKIDQSFIKSIPSSQENAAFICMLIELAHSLGIKVVAEGVETIEQLQFLTQHQCDMAQGYLISRPLPAEKMQEKLVHLR